MPVGPNGEPLPYSIEVPSEQGGGPSPLGAGPAPSESPSGGPDILRSILELAEQYRQVEQDDEDLLAIEKARTLIQQLLAKQQKEQDGLLQGKAPPSALRRALA